MTALRALLALAALTLAACSSAAPSPAPTLAEPTAPVSTSPPPSVGATPASPPGLVGTWLAAHNCQRIIDIMTAAGLPEQALLNAAESGTIPGVSNVDDIADPKNPCAGATDMRHWHFFTASGEFGSLDMNRQRVDDGRWRIVDADTLEINGTRFEFRVDGDELFMEPEDVGTCPVNGQWCPEAWKLMVAMPGVAWTRDD
jgi:hypothetical protein